MMLQVAYEVSVLGLGYINPLARTGVGRFTESLACQLAQIPECDLKFCISPPTRHDVKTVQSTLNILNQSLKFRSANPELRKVPLLHKTQETRILNDINQCLHYLDQIKSLKQHQISLYSSLVQSLLSITYEEWLLDLDKMQKLDIFHSPFFPLPEFTHSLKNLTRLITISDLIPILYPQWFPQNQDSSSGSKGFKGIDVNRDHIICISENTKSDLCNHLSELDPSRVFVTHLAADTQNFFPCKDQELIQEVRNIFNITSENYFLSLGTLEPRKNIAHLIRCFGQLIVENPSFDIQLVLVGQKGWKYNAIFKEVQDLERSIRNKIICTGWVDDLYLAPLYSGSIGFIYPSLYEGFGLPPLEAMACAVPVITSNSSSLPEVVGQSGIMIDPLDADQLTHAMYLLASDSFLCEKLSRQSLQQSQKFSWLRCAHETMGAYRQAYLKNN